MLHGFVLFFFLLPPPLPSFHLFTESLQIDGLFINNDSIFALAVWSNQERDKNLKFRAYELKSILQTIELYLRVLHSLSGYSTELNKQVEVFKQNGHSSVHFWMWSCECWSMWRKSTHSKYQERWVQYSESPLETGGNTEETVTLGQQIAPMTVYCFCCMLFSEWGVLLWLEALPGARSHKEIIVLCLFTCVLFPSLFKEDCQINWTDVKAWLTLRIVKDSWGAYLFGASELNIWLANKNWLKKNSNSVVCFLGESHP